MKKLILLIATLSVCIEVFAQSFELTPLGVVDANDHTKNYVVVNVPNASKDEIFAKAHKYVTAAYNSPGNVMSVSGTDMIAINGYAEAPYSDGMHRCKCGIKYNVNLSFKDGRYKMEFTITSLEMIFNGRHHPLKLQKQGMTNGLFKKDGSITKGGDLAKSDIEGIPNNIIMGITNMAASTDSEDW